MSGSFLIVGVDVDDVGASAVATVVGGDEAFKQLDCTRILGSPPCTTTIVQAEEANGLPYRLELCDPGQIERDEMGVITPSFYFQDSGPQTEQIQLEEHSRAVTFLAKQLLHNRRPSRIGIVVQDNLPVLDAEELLRRLGGNRSRAELVPWPIAAAWTWLDSKIFNTTVMIDHDSARKKIVGKILTIHLSNKGWQVVPLHLVYDSIQEVLPIVPARDREQDDLVSKKWSTSVDETSCISIIADIVHKSKNNINGMVVVGRLLTIEKTIEFKRLLSEATSIKFDNILIEQSERVGLLCRGAIRTAEIVSCGLVPYYESLPQIRLLGSIQSQKISGSLPYRLEYWVDTLEGVEDTIGNTKLARANKVLRHLVDTENIVITPGAEIEIFMAFGSEDVRRFVQSVPGSVIRNEEINIRVEYRFGSGNPKVELVLKNKPKTDPILLEWGFAEIIDGTAEQFSKFDSKTVYEEHRRRLNT